MNLEHPDITRCLLTGYPFPVDEDGDDDQEDWEDEEWED